MNAFFKISELDPHRTCAVTFLFARRAKLVKVPLMIHDYWEFDS